MRESYRTLEKRRTALLKKISKLGPWIMGTPMYTTNKSTITGKRGEPGFAEKMYLTYSEAGNKSGSLYVPLDLREEVAEWVENYWIMKEYMKEMTELSRRMISLYSKSKRKKKRQKA